MDKDKAVFEKKPVTLRDVAAKAEVSPVVVSRVLHNKAQSIRVSEATAERVRQAALDLGYRVNVWARNFRAQQTMNIGVLHGVGDTRPRFDRGSRYFAALMDGIIEGAFKLGYSVTLCPRLFSQTHEDAMGDGRFDGLVWYSSVSSDENLTALARCSVPLVLIHAHTGDFGSRHPAVICDNDQGINLAVDHLIELGHRKIAFALDIEPLNLESLYRLAAFRKRMAYHGINTTKDDEIEVRWGVAEIQEYFSRKLQHTAIVAHTDGLAADFLAQAPGFGLRVPEDLSVIGFDSTSYCDELRPTLTSISQPLASMGERAIELLVKAMGGAGNEPTEIVFPCGLDVRGSTSVHR